MPSAARAVDAFSLPPETRKEALAYIAEEARQADVDEVKASCGWEIGEALSHSLEMSTQAWFLLDRSGLPMGVLGVAPTLVPGVGAPWMLGTDQLEVEWVAVARQTEQHLVQMHEEYSVLYNWVDARNAKAMDWLLWAGFHFIDVDTAYGPEARTFIQFARAS